jgi:hypothetical protein
MIPRRLHMIESDSLRWETSGPVSVKLVPTRTRKFWLFDVLPGGLVHLMNGSQEWWKAFNWADDRYLIWCHAHLEHFDVRLNIHLFHPDSSFFISTKIPS